MDLKKWNICMMEHELSSVETKAVGFLAQKLPKVTHLQQFTAILLRMPPNLLWILVHKMLSWTAWTWTLKF
jgi:hypothetical protein